VDCLETGILAAHTFPGAAPRDDPVACMTDRDGDDWGRDIPPPGVTPGTDCNDLDAAVSPEVIWYNDADGDGFGDPNMTQMSCGQPSGYVSNDQDCLDSGPRGSATFPGAAPNDDPLACMTDVDDDDYGSDSPQPGVTPGTDCDDTDPMVPPGC